jgi:hypothetical protein
MQCNLPKQNGSELLMCKVAPKTNGLDTYVERKGHDLIKDHPNNNTSKVQQNKTC